MLIQCCILSDLIRRIYQIIFVRFFLFAKGEQTFKIKPVNIYSQDHPGRSWKEENLDPNKAHGHYMVSIWMIKICDASICKPLELLFGSYLENGKFPTEWQKANVVPAHRKGDKQNLKNYLPISLLPVAWKIFEIILYNIYEFFTENNLISPN